MARKMNQIPRQINLFSHDYAGQIGDLFFKLHQALTAHADAQYQPPRRDRLTTPQDRHEQEDCEEAAQRRDELARQIYMGLTGKDPGTIAREPAP